MGLAFDAERVRLTVRDTGVGFDEDGTRRGYGLDNMRHRAEELGGDFELSSAAGGGTSIVVSVPIKDG